MKGRPGPQPVRWALFSLKGRIRRATFALGSTFLLTIWWVCLSQVFAARAGTGQQGFWLLFLGVVVIGSNYCLYALAHKRLHDIGSPGFYALMAVVVGVFFREAVLIGYALLALVPGEARANAFGPPPVDMRL